MLKIQKFVIETVCLCFVRFYFRVKQKIQHDRGVSTLIKLLHFARLLRSTMPFLVTGIYDPENGILKVLNRTSDHISGLGVPASCDLVSVFLRRDWKQQENLTSCDKLLI